MEKLVPTIGMGCSLRSGSDSYPYEVIKIIDPDTCHIIVRSMNAYNQVQWPDQNYKYVSNPDGMTVELKMFHNHLREVKVDPVTHRKHYKKWTWYSHYWLGDTVFYEDPSF